jgi:hypothetical protein
LPALLSLFIFFLTGAVLHAADAPLVRVDLAAFMQLLAIAG